MNKTQFITTLITLCFMLYVFIVAERKITFEQLYFSSVHIYSQAERDAYVEIGTHLIDKNLDDELIDKILNDVINLTDKNKDFKNLIQKTKLYENEMQYLMVLINKHRINLYLLDDAIKWSNDKRKNWYKIWRY